MTSHLCSHDAEEIKASFLKPASPRLASFYLRPLNIDRSRMYFVSCAASGRLRTKPSGFIPCTTFSSIDVSFPSPRSDQGQHPASQQLQQHAPPLPHDPRSSEGISGNSARARQPSTADNKTRRPEYPRTPAQRRYPPPRPHLGPAEPTGRYIRTRARQHEGGVGLDEAIPHLRSTRTACRRSPVDLGSAAASVDLTLSVRVCVPLTPLSLYGSTHFFFLLGATLV